MVIFCDIHMHIGTYMCVCTFLWITVACTHRIVLRIIVVIVVVVIAVFGFLLSLSLEITYNVSRIYARNVDIWYEVLSSDVFTHKIMYVCKICWDMIWYIITWCADTKVIYMCIYAIYVKIWYCMLSRDVLTQKVMCVYRKS